MTIFSIIDGSIGNDTLLGTDGFDIITALAGNDSINAGAGDDIIDAGAGSNAIDAGAGNDVILIDGTASNTIAAGSRIPANGIDGGTGFDTAVYTGSMANYHIVNIIGGALQVTDLTTGALDMMINVEHLKFADGEIFLQPGAGDILIGSAAADILTGTDIAESFYGLGGNDRINAAGGDDTINAGGGTNQIDGGAGNDTILIDPTSVNGAVRVPANGIVGGTGYDTVVYSGASTDFNITQVAGGALYVTNLLTGARDIMTEVESLQFSDTTVVLVAPNAAPVISGNIAATMAEDSAAQTFNALAFASDPDAGDTLSVTNLAALPDGVTFDMATQSFVIDPGAAAFQALAANQVMQLWIDYGVTDGTNVTPTMALFTVTGTNDAPIVQGNTGASLIEDALISVTGQLLISDVDTGESGFVATTTPLQGIYGSLTVDASGLWTYTLDNASAAVQSLNSGDVVTDIITVTTLDGTRIPLDFSIQGQNDYTIITGTAGRDTLMGTAGADSILGLDGADKLYGQGGNDVLTGGAGADSLYAGAGDDLVAYDAADRVVDGGTGSDTLQLSGAATVNLAAADQVAGGSSTVTGFENANATTSAGAVVLAGSAGANALQGSLWADVITGRGGADVLSGNAGADRFVFLSTADSTAAAADTITDFTAGEDRIDLTAIDAIRGGANNAFTWIDGAAFTAAGQLRYDAATGSLQADTNGDLIADLHINLAGTPMLSVTDILL